MSDFDHEKKSGRRKQFKKYGSSDRHEEESDMPTMIKKMQQQLVFLERKIDLLLEQSPSKPRTEGFSGGFGSKRDSSFGERSSYKGSKTFNPRGGSRNEKPGEKSFFKGKKSFPSKKRGRS